MKEKDPVYTAEYLVENNLVKKQEFIDDMENETFPTKIVLEDYVNYNAITTTLMNGIMDYQEVAE